MRFEYKTVHFVPRDHAINPAKNPSVVANELSKIINGLAVERWEYVNNIVVDGLTPEILILIFKRPIQ